MLITALVIWQHGTEKLESFLDYLKGLHSNVHFTMEMERNGRLPFLVIDIYRTEDGSLTHKVYGKPSHLNLYPNPGLRYHSYKIQAGSFNLVAQGQGTV
jgi:hypothetical protein